MPENRSTKNDFFFSVATKASIDINVLSTVPLQLIDLPFDPFPSLSDSSID